MVAKPTWNRFVSPGIILVFVTLLSILLANSPFGESYRHFWHLHFTVSVGGHPHPFSILHFINDGLMAVFFLLVGMEIKREIIEGELSTTQKAILPLFAAIGGMIVPALIYLAFNSNSNTQHGWGIPMATDIAFALAILSLLRTSVPGGVRIFLTALAIIDDLGAVLVIALFYSGHLLTDYLLAAAVFVFLLFLLHRFRVKNLIPYLILGIALWYVIWHSGVHSTMAGVLLAIFIPADKLNHRSVLHKLEHQLTPLVNYFILPVFAVANTAMLINTGMIHQLSSPLALGVMIGLLIGKPLGIALFSKLAVKSGMAQLPRHCEFSHLAGAGILGGIGFTMSIFISMLAFEEPARQDLARLSVLVASTIAAFAGYYWMRAIGRVKTV